MSSYHLNSAPISRGKGHSVTCRASYITGKKLEDQYLGNPYYHHRQDVLFQQIFLPANAPQEFHDLQELCWAIDAAECRYDARTGREFICSLPNELPLDEQIRIVTEFVQSNFIEEGLCAIAAIHKGENKEDPSLNNPHAHLIVSTREVTTNGFNEKKARQLDKLSQLMQWRGSWAAVVNAAYERNGLDARVSHESLEVQGIRDREPTIHLIRSDFEKERRGIHTAAGDRQRAIIQRNLELAQKKLLRNQRTIDHALSR